LDPTSFSKIKDRKSLTILERSFLETSELTSAKNDLFIKTHLHLLWLDHHLSNGTSGNRPDLLHFSPAVPSPPLPVIWHKGGSLS
jgi:hypothetical protein